MEKTVSCRLLVALLVVIWLGPLLFWWVGGDEAAQQSGNQLILSEPADSYYSIPDRRCYALIYTATVSALHTMRASPVKLSLVIGGQENLLNEELLSEQPTLVDLQPDEQVLVAEDRAGRRAALGILYLPRDLPTPPLTRTLVVSLSDQNVTAIYVAETPVDPLPQDFDDLIAGRIEPGLFIKRVFYSAHQLDPGLVHCNQFADISRTDFADPIPFAGGELSTIDPHVILAESGVMRVTLEANVSGWRYDQDTAQRLLAVSPVPSGPTEISLFHNQGTVTEAIPLPTLWDGNRLTWVNPKARIALKYDSLPPLATTTDARKLAQMLLIRLRPTLDRVAPYHFCFSLVTTLAAPLLPLVGLWLLRKRDLIGTWPQLVPFVRLSVLLWLGPLVAMFLAFILHRGSLPHAGAALWVAALGSGLVVSVLSAPATFPRLANKVTSWFDHRRAASQLGPWLLVAGLLALSPVLLANLHLIWRHPLTLPLEGLLLALASWSVVGTLTDSEHGLTISPTAWTVCAALMILLSTPLPDTVYLFEPEIGWPVETGRGLFLMWGICVLPYLGLLGGLVVLEKLDTDLSPPLGLSRLVFVLLVGLTGALPQVEPGGRGAVVPYLFSPVPFVLAWLVFRVIVRPVPAPGPKVQGYVLREGKELLTYAVTSASILRDVVLAFGPKPRNWDNGRLVTRYGLILGGALALLYSILLMPGVADQVNTPFLPLMMLSVFVLPIFLRWVLSGFFLGFFFPCLPGRNGAVKGFSLACAIAISVFTYDLIFRVRSSADLQIFFALDVVLTMLGLVGMGALLDYRAIQRAGHTWQQLLVLYRIPYLAGYVSTLLATVSSTVIGIINGRITDLAASLVSTILRAGGG